MIKRNFSIESIGIHTNEDLENYSYEEFCIAEENEKTFNSSVKFSEIPVDAFVLDVRDDWEQPRVEYQNMLIAPLDSINDFANIIPKEEDVFVICQKGGRSQMAIDFLTKEYNFSNLINVDGGVLG